jgi:hypothetical protein
LKLVLTHAFISNIAEELVAAENRRLDSLAHAAADASQLAYPDLVKSFTALARPTT